MPLIYISYAEHVDEQPLSSVVPSLEPAGIDLLEVCDLSTPASEFCVVLFFFIISTFSLIVRLKQCMQSYAS